MKEYKRLHIIKHALENYIERQGASEKDIAQEQSVLNQTIESIEDLKSEYGINEKRVTE